MKFSVKLIFFSVLATLLFSCGENKIQQGEIEYEITYPYNEISGLMNTLLPKKMTVIFKGDKMIITIAKGKMFSTEILSNEKTKELEMRYFFGSDKLKCKLNEADIKNLIASQPVYNFSEPVPGDSMVGCSTHHVKQTLDADSLGIGEFTSIFTRDFSIQNAGWFNSYSSIEGMPLTYLIDRYGIVMKVEAVNFIQREVMDEEFQLTEDYEEISYPKYDKKVRELFELIMAE